jgi:hypothetical protein
MNTEIIDFYSGFEGQPEINIVCEIDHTNSLTIKLWEGYFDSIMSAVQPNEHGQWEGVMEAYHLHLGWYDGEKWKCHDRGLFESQLNNITSPENWDEKTREVYSQLLKFIQNCGNRDGQLYITSY